MIIKIIILNNPFMTTFYALLAVSDKMLDCSMLVLPVRLHIL